MSIFSPLQKQSELCTQRSYLGKCNRMNVKVVQIRIIAKLISLAARFELLVRFRFLLSAARIVRLIQVHQIIFIFTYLLATLLVYNLSIILSHILRVSRKYKISSQNIHFLWRLVQEASTSWIHLSSRMMMKRIEYLLNLTISCMYWQR